VSFAQSLSSSSADGSRRLILQHLEPTIPFSSIIIVEPMISPAGPQHLKKLRSILVKGAYERRDVWPNLEQAMSSLKMRDRTKKWDPRILDLFVVRTYLTSLRHIFLRKPTEICHQTTSWLNFHRNAIRWRYPCLHSRSGSCTSYFDLKRLRSNAINFSGDVSGCRRANETSPRLEQGMR
jgi:hypothetical protein